MNTPVGDPNSSPIGNFDQPVLPILDPAGFGAVRTAIESAFSSSRVGLFLKSLSKAGLRIRHFEEVVGKGLLGGSTKAAYEQLGNGDQGQIREFYLASLERVTPELRQKFFKLYAYY
jgi:hypothetical protein